MRWRSDFVQLASGLIFAAILIASTQGISKQPSLKTTVIEAEVAIQNRTHAGLYITAVEAHAAVLANAAILLIDVRTPGEIVFDGAPATLTRNIPYLVLDEAHEYDPARGSYKLVANPDFPKAVAKLVAEKGTGVESTIILLCTTGERSARAASLLSQSGYSNVYTMVDGVAGEVKTRTGIARGWKPSGLPWGYTLRKDQLYQSPTM